MASVTVVIPTLDDATVLERLLTGLSSCHFEVVVVDGGSRDNSVAVAGRFGYRVLDTQSNRGLQLNTGVAESTGDWLWLLHADSTISPAIVAAIGEITDGPAGWGRFDIQLADASALLKVVAHGMNNRSWLTGICTGDQGMFVHRSLLEAIGGVPEQPLMEDIELSRRLRRVGKPIRRRELLTTSIRRWQRDGVVVTIARMWWFRLRYFFGADPHALARDYYD